MIWSKETNNFINGWKVQDLIHSGSVDSSILKVSLLLWSKKLPECIKQENQLVEVKLSHPGHWMMSFIQPQLNKRINNRSNKAEIKIQKVYMFVNLFYKVLDGTRIVCKLQDQDKCSHLYHYFMLLQLTKRNQVMINQYITALSINIRREQINIWFSEWTWTLKLILLQNGN